MTKKLERLIDFKSPTRRETLLSIEDSFCDFVGPLRSDQLWDAFEDELLIEFRKTLPVRDSALAIWVVAQSLICRQPASSTTDALLRLIQRNSKNEIYPGSREDLGIID